MIKLNSQQQEAAGLIKNWFESYKSTGKQIFVLSGYAGTGKTTLVNYIIDNVLNLSKDKVAFATPTGKAAAVLVQKGSPATTIHRLIYSPVAEDLSTTVNGKLIQTKKINFIKKKSIGNYKLIVLDEISMINKKIMSDLLSYGIPILATGDLGQLPAIAAESHNLLENPDYNLTEIVRQAKENSILDIATKARHNEQIPFGDFGDVIVYNRTELNDYQFAKILTSSDQVICGKNSTRIKLNHYIRKLLGYKEKLPQNGEKIICEQNNYEIEIDERCSLVNGLIGEVKNFKIIDEDLKLATISFKPDFAIDFVDNILIEYNIFEKDDYLYGKHQMVYFMFDGSYKLAKTMFKQDKNENHDKYIQKLREEFMNKKQALGTFILNEFQYGYAISCHKSQGSQWDNVVLIDEHQAFQQDGSKWLYTGITRAAKKLIIIR